MMEEIQVRLRNRLRLLEQTVAVALRAILPRSSRELLFLKMAEQKSNLPLLVEAFGPHFNRAMDLGNMPFDLPVKDELQFENLAGLFASTPMDYGVIAMTVRQAAYIFGLARQMNARRAIEIGRYKGGSTLILAAAMRGEGQLWSIDIGEKEARLHTQMGSTFDQQLEAMLARLGFDNAELLVGDSRFIEIDADQVDLVLIDGDHSYEGVKSDFQRFGRRARVGGVVLLDDAIDDGDFGAHTESVGRLLDEILTAGEFKLVRSVNRLAHLERMH